MRLPIKLALRYVFKARSKKLVHIISVISMLVIALVSMAMIIVLSAFNGLEQLVSELFGTLDSDLALVPKTGEVVPAEFSLHLEDTLATSCENRIDGKWFGSGVVRILLCWIGSGRAESSPISTRGRTLANCFSSQQVLPRNQQITTRLRPQNCRSSRHPRSRADQSLHQ